MTAFLPNSEIYCHRTISDITQNRRQVFDDSSRIRYSMAQRIPYYRCMEPSRWWGDDRAILDDEEARRRLLDAAGHCIVRRGNAQIRMAEVADEAGVSRSTLYRYFRNRDDVLLHLLLARVDTALGELVGALG